MLDSSVANYVQQMEESSSTLDARVARQLIVAAEMPRKPAGDRLSFSAELAVWLTTSSKALVSIGGELDDSLGITLEKEPAELTLRAVRSFRRACRRHLFGPVASLADLDPDAVQGIAHKEGELDAAYRNLLATLSPYVELRTVLASLPAPSNAKQLDYGLMKKMSSESQAIRDKYVTFRDTATPLLDEILELLVNG
ncbi:hypothetical protein ACX80Z_15405 [Arthrobacter sp. TMT4-20]